MKPHLAQSGAVTVPSVVSGEFEFGYSNTTSLVVAISKGLPLRIVTRGTRGGSDRSESFADVLVRADGPIRSARDLEGKTISVPGLANIPSLTTNAALEKRGVDISTIKYIEIGLPEATPALDTGRVEAIWVTEPFSTLGLQAGHRSVLKPMVETAPDYITAATSRPRSTSQTMRTSSIASLERSTAPSSIPPPTPKRSALSSAPTRRSPPRSLRGWRCRTSRRTATFRRSRSPRDWRRDTDTSRTSRTSTTCSTSRSRHAARRISRRCRRYRR